ncbi:MAG: tRNA threonylcarbamoyladenosine dehydratase [Clostridia bacterium]|nr:tRNA threonylcarbamoyladenosine dehydratase [Clostridia bacterium]
MERFSREISLIGVGGLLKLKNSRVAVFGLGGVGGHATEALARAGVGALDIIDGDVFSTSNLNRQRFATMDSVGKPKAETVKAELLKIDDTLTITAINEFFTAESVLDFSAYDYVLDCIDTVSSKLEIITRANASGVPVISCMGAGNKLDPTAFKVADIYQTKVCPLARVMRKECKERGIPSLKVVYSEEQPVTTSRTPASISFVPSTAGLIMASVCIKDLLA